MAGRADKKFRLSISGTAARMKIKRESYFVIFDDDNRDFADRRVGAPGWPTCYLRSAGRLIHFATLISGRRCVRVNERVTPLRAINAINKTRKEIRRPHTRLPRPFVSPDIIIIIIVVVGRPYWRSRTPGAGFSRSIFVRPE